MQKHQTPYQVLHLPAELDQNAEHYGGDSSTSVVTVLASPLFPIQRLFSST